MATRNPIEMEGTYPLPEAQLDRFLFSIRLLYPSSAELVDIVRLTTGDGRTPVAPVFAAEEAVSVIEEMKGRARLCAQAVDQALEASSYLLGDDFSAADIMMGYTLRSYGRLVDEPLPKHVERYWTTLTERAAFQATEAADKSIQAR